MAHRPPPKTPTRPQGVAVETPASADATVMMSIPPDLETGPDADATRMMQVMPEDLTGVDAQSDATRMMQVMPEDLTGVDAQSDATRMMQVMPEDLTGVDAQSDATRVMQVLPSELLEGDIQGDATQVVRTEELLGQLSAEKRARAVHADEPRAQSDATTMTPAMSDDVSEPPKKKPSLFRRILKALGWSLLVILVLIVVVIGFFHTGWGKSTARGIVESVIADQFDGDVTLGGIDYALFGDLHLDNLKIKEKGGRTALHLASVDISPDWGSLLSSPTLEVLTIDGLELDLIAYADGTNSLLRMQKVPPKIPEILTIAKIDVRNLTAKIELPNGARLHLAEVSTTGRISLDVLARHIEAEFDSAKAKVAVVSTDLSLNLPLSLSMKFNAAGGQGSLELASAPTTATIKTQGLTREVPLAMKPVKGRLARGRVSFDLSGLELGPLKIEQILAEATLPEAAAPLDAPLSFEVRGLALSAAEVAKIAGKPVLGSDVRAEISARGKPAAITLAGRVDTEGGDLVLEGVLDLRNLLVPVYDVRLSGTDIDTTKLLSDRGLPGVRTSFTTTAKGQGIPLAVGQMRLRVELGETQVADRGLDSVSLDVTTEGRLARVEGLVVEAFGQTIIVDGQLDRDTREFEGRLKLSSELGDAISKARTAGVLVIPLPPLEGDLDATFGISGRLKPDAVLEALAKNPPPVPSFDDLPFENLKIKGLFRGLYVKALGRDFGNIDVDAEFAFDETGMKSLVGHLETRLEGLDFGRGRIDAVDLSVRVEGLTHHVTLSLSDKSQGLSAALSSRHVIDLEARHVDIHLDKLELQRGALTSALTAPIVIGLDQPVGKPQRLVMPKLRLALAGGEVALSTEASLSPDPAHPGATRLDDMKVDISLEGIDLPKSLALAGLPSRGLRGRMDGTLSLRGTPEQPELALSGTLVSGFSKKTARSTLELSIFKGLLEASLDVSDGHPLLSLSARAPIVLPTKLGDAPRLGAGGLTVKASLDATLGRILALAPKLALPELDKDAQLAGRLELVGTALRPEGEWSLEVDGAFGKLAGLDKAPSHQRLRLSGELVPSGPSLDARSNLELWLDKKAPPTLTHRTKLTFERSPLAFPKTAWTLEADLEPLDLEKFAPLTPLPLEGRLTSSARANGTADALEAKLVFGAEKLKVGLAPATDAKTAIAITPKGLTLEHTTLIGGLEALAAEIEVELPDLHSGFSPAHLLASPLRGTITIPEHPLGEWVERLTSSKSSSLPGSVGGKLELGGTLRAPLARGALSWRGFETASARPHLLGLELDLDHERLATAIFLGFERALAMSASLPLEALSDLSHPILVDLRMQADADLRDLVPAFVLGPKAPELTGRLDWDMSGLLLLGRDPSKPLARGSALSGTFAVSALDIAIPDMDRAFSGGEIRLSATHSGLVIDRIHVGERDLQRDDRRLELRGRLDWEDLHPDNLELEISTHRWLVGGLGLDVPDAELDAKIEFTASALDAPVKDVHVLIKELSLHGPDRFIRAHYPQRVSVGDVIYTDNLHENQNAHVFKHLENRAYPRLPKKGAFALPPLPEGEGVNVAIRIPQPIDILASDASPIAVTLQGEMDVLLKGSDLKLEGRIDITRGWLGAMGRDFTLDRGAITANGGLETALAELVFSVAPTEVALRDVARGDHGGRSTITVRASPTTGLQTIFGGVSGPYLLDMATFLNTGRARLWGQPDAPVSGTVRFGNLDQGLVNTFVQTNLRNLIFADRANAWSSDGPAVNDYGRLANFDLQRFLPAEDRFLRPDARVHVRGTPLSVGQNELELGYSWLFLSKPRAVMGFGPTVGLDALRLGLGLTFDWSSAD